MDREESNMGKARIRRKDAEQESNAVWGKLSRNILGQSLREIPMASHMERRRTE